MSEEAVDTVDLNDVEVVEEKPTVEVGPVAYVPAQNDTDWSEYVMTHFAEDELIDGNPNVAGLRRVAGKLMGEITTSRSTVVQAPNPANEFNSTVAHLIVIETETGPKEYEEVADAGPNNIHQEYKKFPTAIASTRAEARALRKALKLRCVASDELPTAAPEGVVVKSELEKELDENRMINNSQINFLDTIGKRLDVDLLKFVNSGKTKYASVEQIPESTAKQMIAYLSNEQTKGKLSLNVKGYDPSWKVKK